MWLVYISTHVRYLDSIMLISVGLALLAWYPVQIGFMLQLDFVKMSRFSPDSNVKRWWYKTPW